jgi:methyltransferase (TIGR00027 family)
LPDAQPSLTALITAFARSFHSRVDRDKIFDDFLAPQLFTDEEHAFLSQNLAAMLQVLDPAFAATHPSLDIALAHVIQSMNGPITLSRSRYSEDLLLEAIREGVQQVVILGAGLDTFAFRHSELLDRIRVFEIDHPATQADKLQRIARAGWVKPPQLHFVPVDFATGTLEASLGQSPYDRARSTFFSWLGVIYYLEHEAVMGTFQQLAGLAPRESRIVFDYLDAEAFTAGAPEELQLTQRVVKRLGEPMKTGFDPKELGTILIGRGWRLVEDLSPAAIEERFFQGRSDRYHAKPLIHFASAVLA